MYALKKYAGIFILLSFLLLESAQAFQVNSPVVHFSLRSLNDNSTHTPEQYKGQVLVLFFLGHN